LSDPPWLIGIDLGATKTALGLIDPDDRIVAHHRISTDAEQGPHVLVQRIAKAIEDLQRDAPLAPKPDAIGICSPGPVDHVSGLLVDPPNLQGLHHAPLRDLLSGATGLPVVLEHDAKAAALGEFHYGAGREWGDRDMVYIVVGTGVGAAIILDGELYRGPRNSAGEIGHTMLDPEGERCACGSRGCVETYLSGPWLAHHYRHLYENEHNIGPDQAVTGETVAALATQGDPLARAVFERAGKALGIAVGTMAMTLDVALFVVGGSVANAGDLLFEPARRMVPDCSYDSVSCHVRIVPTTLKEDGPILGCGWLARRSLST
jgi:glucokinase